MKLEQAPIEIAKELHELNKKLDEINRIRAKRTYIIGYDPVHPPYPPDSPYPPNIITTPYYTHEGTGDPAPNPNEITCATGNPEAHDYGVGYINVLEAMK